MPVCCFCNINEGYWYNDQEDLWSKLCVSCILRMGRQEGSWWLLRLRNLGWTDWLTDWHKSESCVSATENTIFFGGFAHVKSCIHSFDSYLLQSSTEAKVHLHIAAVEKLKSFMVQSVTGNYVFSYSEYKN